MFKKVLSFMLALAMLATLVVAPVSAAENEGVLVFEENFDNPATSIARFEQFGPNDSAATFIVKENYWGSSSNVLKFDTDGTPQNFTGNAARAAIKGQEFGDVRIEFDYTVGPNSKSYVMFRMDDEYNGIAMQLGASNTAPYKLQHGAYKINAGVPDTSGLFFVETNNEDGLLWDNVQYANHHAVIEVIGNSFTTKIYDGETLISTNEVNTTKSPNLTFPAKGNIVFSVANSAFNTFDNIKVYDLSATVAPEVEMIPADGSVNVAVDSEVVLTYSDDVTDEVVNAITVSPEVSFAKNYDGKTVTLSFTNGLAYNTTYTVTSGDFSSSFTTELDMSNILFMEDFTDAAASIARFEQYGPNANGAGGAFEVKGYWGTRETEGNSLNFGGSANGHKFDTNAPRAAIDDSNWSDVRVEFDYTTGPEANSYVMLRMDENYNGIEVQLGSGKGTKYTYELINGISTMTAGAAKYDYWGNITYGEDSYINWNDSYANRHAVIEIKGTTLTSSIYDGENLISTAVAENIQTPNAGKIVFAVSNSQNTFDNIVVTDISGKSADTPLSITPADGAENVSVLADAVLTYKKDVTDEFVEAVSVSPAVEYRTVVDGKTLMLCFDDALDYDTTYTITAGDATATFTTEALSNDVIFSEDFTDATASLAKFEQYGPNAAGTDKFEVGNFWGTSSNALKFNSNTNGHSFTGDAARAAIVGSDWSDFRLEFDYTTGPKANSYIMLRMDENYNGIEVQLGSGDGTTYTYELINGINTMKAGAAQWDYWGNTTYGADEYRNWNNSYANRHAVIEIKGTTLTSSIYDGENLISTAVAENIQTPDAGKIVFAVNNTQNTFDNIKITPLGLEFTPDKVKNVQDVISLTFDEPLANTNKWDELIEVKDADGNAVEFSTALNINTGKQVKITLADPKDGEYTITVKKGVAAQLGATTQSDKSFKVLVTMPYCVKECAIGNLTAGSKVTADAVLSHSVMGTQDYTLVLAIYTNEGYLYDVAFDTKTFTVPTSDEDFSVTSDLALPTGDITGYTAAAWFIDNLTNIKPMSHKVTK